MLPVVSHSWRSRVWLKHVVIRNWCCCFQKRERLCWLNWTACPNIIHRVARTRSLVCDVTYRVARTRSLTCDIRLLFIALKRFKLHRRPNKHNYRRTFISSQTFCLPGDLRASVFLDRRSNQRHHRSKARHHQVTIVWKYVTPMNSTAAHQYLYVKAVWLLFK